MVSIIGPFASFFVEEKISEGKKETKSTQNLKILQKQFFTVICLALLEVIMQITLQKQ